MMSTAWKQYALGELAEYVNGRAFKPEDWGKTGLPIIRIQNLTNAGNPFNFFDGPVQDQHLVNNGDLLISWSATLGSFIWTRGQAVLNQHIFKVTPVEAMVDKEFLHYLVLNTLDAMADHAHGIAMKHITKKKFEALRVLVPDLAEQRRIVARIKECMERVDEIETLRAETLCERSALSSSLIESAIRSQAGVVELPVGNLVTKIRNGHSITEDSTGKADGAVLTLTAVRSINLGMDFWKPIVLPEKVYRQFSIQMDDVFVSRANTIELVGLSAVSVCSPPERMIYPDLLIKLTADRKKITPRYLAYALRSSSARRQIKDRALGSSQTMVKISGERLREIAIPVPGIDAQEKIVDRLDAAHSLVVQLSTALAEEPVSTLRDSILRKAFAGEL